MANETKQYLIELVEILAKPIQDGGEGMADCAESPLSRLLARMKRKPPLNPKVEEYRRELMARYAGRFSMEKIAAAAYILADEIGTERTMFEEWAKIWYRSIKSEEFITGCTIDKVWVYDSPRLQHSWSGYLAGREAALKEAAQLVSEYHVKQSAYYNNSPSPYVKGLCGEIAEAILKL